MPDAYQILGVEVHVHVVQYMYTYTPLYGGSSGDVVYNVSEARVYLTSPEPSRTCDNLHPILKR